MSVRPLPGASYHTYDTVLLDHSFAYSDLEPTSQPDAYGPFEKHFDPSEKHKPLIDQPHRTRRGYRRGPPVLQGLLVLCCLALVASALWGHSPHRLRLPDVPDRHVALVSHLSYALQAQSYRTLVDANFEDGLELIEQKYKCSRAGCDQANLRDSLLQAFPLVHGSVDQTSVAESAVVLHWQGMDDSLEPVLITNSDAVLDVRAPQFEHADLSSPREDDEMEVFTDIQSGVGMLIAVDALLRFGYQPYRTLVFSLMLGEASDAPKLSEYLHATYGASGLDMEFVPPMAECKKGSSGVLSMFRALIGRIYGATVAPRPTTATSWRIHGGNLDDDAPRLFRYIFSPAIGQEVLTTMRMQAIDVWARLILGADGN